MFFATNTLWSRSWHQTEDILKHLSPPQDKALPMLLNSTPEISEKRRDPNGPRLECSHNGIILIVNCFQKSYLWLLNTTRPFPWTFCTLLWIAFKNLIFDYWTQHSLKQWKLHFCCELLSKILGEMSDCGQYLIPIYHACVRNINLEISLPGKCYNRINE